MTHLVKVYRRSDRTPFLCYFLWMVFLLQFVVYSVIENVYSLCCESTCQTLHTRAQHSCVVPPEAMDLKVLEDAVRDMDRRKVQDEVNLAAKSGLDAAASIGTETPMVILRDIRRCITDLSQMLMEREQAEQEREIQTERRHNEMIATLQRIGTQTSTVSAGSRASISRESMGSVGGAAEKRLFYHHDTKITTGAQVVAVVLMQLDSVLQNSGQLPDDGAKDAVMLDLKGWSSPIIKVAAAESGVTSNKLKLDLPKLSQQETMNALDIVSSTIQGRATPFRVGDLLRLQQSCAGLMGIVEEIRQRIMRCPGIIPEGRRLRLAYLRWPFITREEELNISMVADGFVKAGPLVTDGVPKLKDDGKKFYISEVLGKGTVPVLAFNKARNINQPTSA
jgi:hypothetical protein